MLQYIVIALGVAIVGVVVYWCVSPDFRRRIETPKYRFKARQQYMDGTQDRHENDGTDDRDERDR